MITDLNSEDRLVQHTFADHLERALGWRNVYAFNAETFGPTVDEWRAEVSPGKKVRLSFLLATLALPKQINGAIRYQLLHRAASAVLEGERYRAKAAVLLVHSFSAKRAGWSDYRAFLNLFGVEAENGKPQLLGGNQAVPLFAVWVPGNLKFLEC